jgi:hypothetical protein
MTRRRPARELRIAIDCLPLQTRKAMLEGIEANRIIVGAYTDRQGGVCPMLAAHRNGGRTSLASFARSWDRYTGAKRPRLATRREVRTLRALLETSLARDETLDGRSIAELAAEIRTERADVARRRVPARTVVPEPVARAISVRRRRPSAEHKDLLAIAEEQLAADDVTAAPLEPHPG